MGLEALKKADLKINQNQLQNPLNKPEGERPHFFRHFTD